MITHSFDKVIADVCDLELSALLNSYKYTVYGGHTVAIEGHGGLLRYTREAVTVKLSKGTLTVHGSNLVLRNLSKRTLVVTGNRLNVEVSE